MAKPSDREWLVFRGINTEYGGKLEIGQVYEDKGYVSTSLQPARSVKFSEYSQYSAYPTILRIELPKGTKVIYPDNPLEREIILPRSTKFKAIIYLTQQDIPIM